MISMPITQLPRFIEGQFYHFAETFFTGVSTDTRTLAPGNLFVALSGNKFDGHRFLEEAAKKGAAAALVMQSVDAALPCYQVTDTCLALGKLAQAWRQTFLMPLIAVTGSSGKTTTKNMLKAIFLEAYQKKEDSVLATVGNLNNHIGVPLTLAKLDQRHCCAVVEMGMNHPGEIRYLSQLAQPTTALIVNAGPCHLEGVGGTMTGVAQAKGEIFEGLSSEGLAIINADDVFADYWKSLVPSKRVLTFGIENLAEVRGQIEKEGFFLCYKDQRCFIQLSLLGQHNVMNALAASAAALAHGIDLATIKNALEALSPASGRLEVKLGKEGACVIDDTYNANPLSLRAALQAISGHKGEKILVLGDMRELGEQAVALHEASGKLIREQGIDVLLAIGELTKHAVKSFGQNAYHFEDYPSLIQAAQKYLKNTATILVKGSRSMQLEVIVSALIN